jgi:hypothetical protein
MWTTSSKNPERQDENKQTVRWKKKVLVLRNGPLLQLFDLGDLGAGAVQCSYWSVPCVFCPDIICSVCATVSLAAYTSGLLQKWKETHLFPL